MTSSYSQAHTGAVAEQSAPVGTSAVARWYWVQTKILHHRDLSTAEICVAVVLASHVNDRTQACFPKIETIAHETSLSDRKVRQALKRLAELGLVEKLARAVGRLRNRNAYQLIGLGSKPAPGSIIPASDSAVKPARGADSNKKNTDEREQTNVVSGAGATVLPAVDDQCLILAREWQRLCSEPWTLANACLRVNEAIDRVGFDGVRSELDGLRQKGKRPSRLMLLDALDDLQTNEPSGHESSQWQQVCDENAPESWREICRVISKRKVSGCRNPGAWLSKIKASLIGDTLLLSANNRCVRDTARYHLLTEIREHAGQRGLVVKGLTYD
ncbi:MAG: replication protein [Thalassospira sp.]|uniref:helix-turn-helix domain-containing protein n=1 Tax=Thalassospira sp. GB04J01 TaxID=1485225 RepID=UPI000C0CF7E9|nr:helix-turn-helix domain-containing protein [Thalassospira sp. GB04J01]MBV18031.1 replication protein [Thalassospira sp.]|tara:strand:+ start:558 stop:1544 length:987 start_codon:yes stop_codon:yes gene_type:complete